MRTSQDEGVVDLEENNNRNFNTNEIYEEQTIEAINIDSSEETVVPPITDQIQIHEKALKDIAISTSKIGLPFAVIEACNQLGDLVTTIIVSRHSSNTLAAFAVFDVFRDTITGVERAFLVPIRPLSSHSYGANQKKRISSILQAGWIIGSIFTLPTSAFFLFGAKPLLSWMNYPKDVIDEAKSFFLPYAFAVLPTRIIETDILFLSAIGKEKMIMLWMIGTSVTGSALQYFLTNGFFNYTKGLGTLGAGLSISLQAWIGCLTLKTYFLLNKELHQYDFLKINFSEIKNNMINISRYGFPISMLALSKMPLAIINNKMVSSLGKNRLALNKIIGTLNKIIYIPIHGLTTGMEILISRDYGANIPANISKYYHIGLISSLALSVTNTAILTALSSQLANLYNINDNSSENIDFLIRISFLSLSLSKIADYMSNVNDTALRALLDTWFPALARILTGYAIILPVSYLAGLAINFDLPGFYLASLTGNIIDTVATSIRFKSKLNFLIKEDYLEVNEIEPINHLSLSNTATRELANSNSESIETSETIPALNSTQGVDDKIVDKKQSSLAELSFFSRNSPRFNRDSNLNQLDTQEVLIEVIGTENTSFNATLGYQSN